MIISVEYIITAILLIIFGWFLNVVIETLKQKKWWKKFIYHLSTAEQYWRVSAVFILVIVTVGISIIYLSPSETVRSDNLALLIDVSTLVFGLYVGYFAFKQVSLGRFKTIADQANNYFTEGNCEKAIKEYESAERIQFEFSVASEQAECYVCLDDWNNFERIISLLPNAQVDEREMLVLFYLRSLRHFFSENIRAAKQIVKEAVEAKKKMKKTTSLKWQINEIEGLDAYKNLEEHTRNLLKSFVQYLNDDLSEVRAKEFEAKYGVATKK